MPLLIKNKKIGDSLKPTHATPRDKYKKNTESNSNTPPLKLKKGIKIRGETEIKRKKKHPITTTSSPPPPLSP